jgi:hypothetical protein
LFHTYTCVADRVGCMGLRVGLDIGTPTTLGSNPKRAAQLRKSRLNPLIIHPLINSAGGDLWMRCRTCYAEAFLMSYWYHQVYALLSRHCVFGGSYTMTFIPYNTVMIGIYLLERGTFAWFERRGDGGFCDTESKLITEERFFIERERRPEKLTNLRRTFGRAKHVRE